MPEVYNAKFIAKQARPHLRLNPFTSRDPDGKPPSVLASSPLAHISPGARRLHPESRLADTSMLRKVYQQHEQWRTPNGKSDTLSKLLF